MMYDWGPVVQAVSPAAVSDVSGYCLSRPSLPVIYVNYPRIAKLYPAIGKFCPSKIPTVDQCRVIFPPCFTPVCDSSNNTQGTNTTDSYLLGTYGHSNTRGSVQPCPPIVQLRAQSIEPQPIMASINFPKEELAIIQRWREIKAFETQVRTRFKG